MNKIELENILKKDSFDILQKIFDYMSEDLAKTNEQNIKDLEKIDYELTEKFELLKQEFKLLDENKKDSISKVLPEYICAILENTCFSMKKCVYLIVIYKIKCIYAKSHAFSLFGGVSITLCSCKII